MTLMMRICSVDLPFILLFWGGYGGALLLGTKKPVIKAHGSSDAKAFYNAIRQAISCCENNIIGEMESQLAVETAEAE